MALPQLIFSPRFHHVSSHLGTRNRKKVEELTDLLRDLPLHVVDLSAYPDAPEIEETGKTFEENARLKAVGVARAIKQWVLAEDSGLVVPR